jgi:hypothetical protein
MTDAITPPPLPRTRRHRWLLILPIIVMIPMFAVLVWYVSVRVSNRSAVQELEAKVRARGEPLTLEDLAARFPPIPEDENAAVLLMEVWEKEDPAHWRSFRAGQRTLPTPKQSEFDPDLPYLGSEARRIPRGAPLSSTQLAAAEAWMQKNADHSAAVRAALQRTKCRFPIRVTDGYDALLPHYVEIRQEAQRFRVEALHASEKGDIESAIEALITVQRVANTLTNEPLLIAHLIHVACQLMVLDGAEQLLSRQRLAVPQLARVRTIIDSIEMTNRFRSALIGERAVALGAILVGGQSVAGLARHSEVSEAEMQRGLSFLHFIGLAAADRRLMLETFERAITLAEKPTPEAWPEFARLEAEVKREARGFPPKIFSTLLLPALSATAQKFASVEARRSAGIAAIAVEQYRRAHEDQLPASWNVIIPTHLSRPPIDPFTGEPLKLKPLPKGFVVYSVGANEKDDDGRERPEKRSQTNYDETFTVER